MELSPDGPEPPSIAVFNAPFCIDITRWHEKD